MNVRLTNTNGAKRENWLVMFDWSKYADLIKENGINISDMREKKYGVWIAGKKGEFDLNGWVP